MRRECREHFPRQRLKTNRGALTVVHVGIAKPLWWGKRSMAFPVHAQPAILRIWQKAHGFSKIKETNKRVIRMFASIIRCFHYIQMQTSWINLLAGILFQRQACNIESTLKSNINPKVFHTSRIATVINYTSSPKKFSHLLADMGQTATESIPEGKVFRWNRM